MKNLDMKYLEETNKELLNRMEVKFKIKITIKNETKVKTKTDDNN